MIPILLASALPKENDKYHGRMITIAAAVIKSCGGFGGFFFHVMKNISRGCDRMHIRLGKGPFFFWKLSPSDTHGSITFHGFILSDVSIHHVRTVMAWRCSTTGRYGSNAACSAVFIRHSLTMNGVRPSSGI